MRHKFIVIELILVLVFAFSTLALGQKHYKDLKYPKLREITIPEPKQITLKNGIKVFLLEDHELPFISMRAQFVAGSAWEPADKVGLARITGTVMRTGGSKTMPGDQMDEELESIAASVETWIAILYGGASMSTLKDHFDKVLGVFADVLMDPAFPDDKIELAKIEARSVISRRNDQVTQIANREFNQLIYGEDSQYYRDTEYATIDAITREDIVNFHKKYVRPNGMVLGVWGDFKTNDMIKKIGATFKDWKPVGSAEIVPPKVDYKFKKTVNLVEKTDVNQTNIYMGHIGGKKDNPDNAALIMMNEVLSGGFSSRLFSRLRSDQGLAYAVFGAYGTNYVFPGAFYMGLMTKSERTVEAIRSMFKELRLMTEELVTDEELKVAQEGWLNSFVFNFDSVDEIMGRLLTYAYYGYPLDFLQKTKAEIEAVTKQDILRVAKKYLKPDQVQILAVGKPVDFDEPLSVLGEVNQIDITIPQPKEKAPEATAESLEKGKKLFEKALAAIGDVEKIEDIKNFSTKMDLTQITPMGEMLMDGEMTIEIPDKVHLALNTPQGEMTMVINGANGVMKSPMGTMPMPEQQRKNLIANVKRDPIYIAQNLDNYKIQFIEKGKFGESDAVDLLFTEGENIFHMYLNPESLLPLGTSYQETIQTGPAKVEEFFSEYTDVDGVKVPFKSIGKADGKKQSEVSIKEITFNVKLEEKYFSVE